MQRAFALEQTDIITVASSMMRRLSRAGMALLFASLLLFMLQAGLQTLHHHHDHSCYDALDGYHFFDSSAFHKADAESAQQVPDRPPALLPPLLIPVTDHQPLLLKLQISTVKATPVLLACHGNRAPPA